LFVWRFTTLFVYYCDYVCLQANSAADSGDIASAHSHAKTARALVIASIVLGVVTVVVVILVVILELVVFASTIPYPP
jgi:hypothetical protein